jgi:hypothetical protein
LEVFTAEEEEEEDLFRLSAFEGRPLFLPLFLPPFLPAADFLTLVFAGVLDLPRGIIYEYVINIVKSIGKIIDLNAVTL